MHLLHANLCAANQLTFHMVAWASTDFIQKHGSESQLIVQL